MRRTDGGQPTMPEEEGGAGGRRALHADDTGTHPVNPGALPCYTWDKDWSLPRARSP
jgi:hypothetical protein